jgi:fucose 4-O-acetylase-like acetyltransferase
MAEVIAEHDVSPRHMHYSWIDSLKGIGIILVVFAHVFQGGETTRVIFAFHIPLFFIVSGALFVPRNSLGTFTKKRVLRLLVPYGFFACITWTYWVLIERSIRDQHESVAGTLVNVVIAQGGIHHYPYNAALWFLPCLFVAGLAFFVLIKYGHISLSSRITKTVVFVVLVSAGLGISYYLQQVLLPARLPFTLDIVPVAVAFTAVGYFCKKPILTFAKFLHNGIFGQRKSMNLVARGLILLSAVVLYAALVWVVIASGLRVDLNNLTISNPVALFCSAILGTAATGLISVVCDYKVLQYLGECSLTIMCIHEPIKRVVIVFFGKLLGHFLPEIGGGGVRENWVTASMVTVVTLAIAVLIHLICGKYVPVAVGKARIITADVKTIREM